MIDYNRKLSNERNLSFMLFYERYLTTTGPEIKLNSTAIDIFTLYALMDSSFRIETINFGRSIVYINRLLFQNKIVFLSLKIVFILANRVDPDEMPYYNAFHQGLHCL